MNMENRLDQFEQGIKKYNLRLNEPMYKHTSFKIGGSADLLIAPRNIEELSFALKVCKTNKIPYYILGNGSNVLIKDNGYRGVIIQLSKNLQDVKNYGEFVYAQAGVLLSKLAKNVAKKSLTGFEFASGIPGTLGGAIYMNAGAYGGEMRDILVSADIIDSNGEIIALTKDELELGYRTSIMHSKKYIVVGALLKFEKGNEQDIRALTSELNKKRKTKQPLEYSSAGSTFKRPEGYYAGKLIMDAGLSGYRIGNAQVSSKHCGFIINRGNASATEVICLIRFVQDVVQEKFGVALEPEVKIIGE